jgi:predicted acetyltransferase
VQVLDFMRLEWSDVFHDDERFRDRLFDDPDAVHFVRAAGRLLVSHAQVLAVRLEVDGGPLRIGGVAGVMTYPQFRGEGHASALMRAAATHIAEAGFDLGMLFTDRATVPFYDRLGWAPLEEGRVVVDGAPHGDDVVMILGDVAALPTVLRLDWTW